jgi:bacteriocin resistance YdeI/OmpD-like protein/uncharacterized protein DUF1905
MPSKTVTVQLHRDGSMCFVPVTFDPKAVFGKIRAPVRVTLNGYTYRSTIASMGGVACIPLRKSNREAAGLTGDETLPVKIELDTQAREVELPKDLADALRSDRAALKRWEALSYTHKREHVVALEGARKPETRARRFAAILQALRAKRESWP